MAEYTATIILAVDATNADHVAEIARIAAGAAARSQPRNVKASHWFSVENDDPAPDVKYGTVLGPDIKTVLGDDFKL